jgi:hypothetical protein
MSDDVKNRTFYTLINIALTAFLILATAFCIVSVADVGISETFPGLGSGLSTGNIMICAFDKCSFI